MTQATQTSFTELLQEGKAAYEAGNRRRAHVIWRRAAVISPHDEQVWLALFSVVDNDVDRQVCLQNIVAINPDNAMAKDHLERVSARLGGALDGQRPGTLHNEAQRPFWRVVVWWLEALTLGALLAVALALASHIF